MSQETHQEEDRWEEWEDEGPEYTPTTCPVSGTKMPSVPAAWERLSSEYNINIAQLMKDSAWHFELRVKLVNYLRRAFANSISNDTNNDNNNKNSGNNNNDTAVNSLAMIAKGKFDPVAFASDHADDDSLLKPFLQDDPMLYEDPFPLDDEDGNNDDIEGNGANAITGKTGENDEEIARLEEIIKARKGDIMKEMEGIRERRKRSSNNGRKKNRKNRRSSRSSSSSSSCSSYSYSSPTYSSYSASSEYSSYLSSSPSSDSGNDQNKKNDEEKNRNKNSASSSKTKKKKKKTKKIGKNNRKHSSRKPAQLGSMRIKKDGSYFRSYARHEIHEDMIKDAVRTGAYRDAIEKNPDTFKDKIVLDIGCGTGILSMFAARAGAKKVIGIDLSDIADTAKKVVARNGFSEVITIIKGRVEEVTLPDGIDSVDVIISEWMGYALLYESMLGTVLWARDKWLVEGGKVFPDIATIKCAALRKDDEMHSAKIDYWNSVYGFDMADVAELVKGQIQGQRKEPSVDVFRNELVASKNADVRAFDARTMKSEEQDFISECKIEIGGEMLDKFHQGKETSEVVIDALLVYFDIDFIDGCETHPVTFSTGPACTPTHWMQTVFHLPSPVTCKPGDIISARWAFERRRKNRRTYAVSVTYNVIRPNEEADCSENVIGYGGATYDLV